MLKSAVDEELLIDAQVTATELRHERDELKLSNAQLAHKLSRVQDVLSRLRREKESCEAALAAANAALYDELKRKTAALEEAEANRRSLAAGVCTLEGILADAMEEKRGWDAQRESLLGELSRRKKSVVGQSTDGCDIACVRDQALQTATVTVRVLDEMRAAVKSLQQDAEQQSVALQHSCTTSIVAATRACKDALRVDEEIISALQSDLAKSEAAAAALQRQVATAEEAARERKEALVQMSRDLRDRDGTIAELRTTIQTLNQSHAAHSKGPHRTNTPSEESFQREVRLLNLCLHEEKVARQQEKEEAGRQRQQAVEVERRLTTYIEQLESILHERGSLSEALIQRRLEDECMAVQQRELTKHGEMVAAEVDAFARTVQGAVEELRTSVKSRTKRSLSSLGQQGLSSSRSTTSSSLPNAQSPSPRPPRA